MERIPEVVRLMLPVHVSSDLVKTRRPSADHRARCHPVQPSRLTGCWAPSAVSVSRTVTLPFTPATNRTLFSSSGATQSGWAGAADSVGCQQPIHAFHRALAAGVCALALEAHMATRASSADRFIVMAFVIAGSPRRSDQKRTERPAVVESPDRSSRWKPSKSFDRGARAYVKRASVVNTKRGESE